MGQIFFFALNNLTIKISMNVPQTTTIVTNLPHAPTATGASAVNASQDSPVMVMNVPTLTNALMTVLVALGLFVLIMMEDMIAHAELALIRKITSVNLGIYARTIHVKMEQNVPIRMVLLSVAAQKDLVELHSARVTILEK